MGVISCLGHDVDDLYSNLLQGKSGITPIIEFPCEELTTRFGGVIRNFNSEGYIDKKQGRRVDKFIAYAIVAGKKAIEMGKLTGQAIEELNKERCGILIGSGMGGMEVFSEGVTTLNERGSKKVTPFFVPYIITNMGGAL